MNTNASAKLKTPRVTGCTSGAAPRRSIPNLFSSGSTKKKSVDSAITSLSVSGATAHAGAPRETLPPGGREEEDEPVRRAERGEPARRRDVGLARGRRRGCARSRRRRVRRLRVPALLPLRPELLLHERRDRADDGEGDVPELRRGFDDVPRVHELARLGVDAVEAGAPRVRERLALELDVPRHADADAAAVRALVHDEEHVVRDAVARLLEEFLHRGFPSERLREVEVLVQDVVVHELQRRGDVAAVDGVVHPAHDALRGDGRRRSAAEDGREAPGAGDGRGAARRRGGRSARGRWARGDAKRRDLARGERRRANASGCPRAGRRGRGGRAGARERDAPGEHRGGGRHRVGGTACARVRRVHLYAVDVSHAWRPFVSPPVRGSQDLRVEDFQGSLNRRLPRALDQSRARISE